MSAGYLNGCYSGGVPKRRHPDKTSAEQHRKHMIRTGGWTKDKSNTYRCIQCGNWHAGRITGGKRRRGKR